MDSDYPFGILDIRILITLWYLRYTDSDYPFGIFKLFLGAITNRM